MLEQVVYQVLKRGDRVLTRFRALFLSFLVFLCILDIDCTTQVRHVNGNIVAI